MEDIARTMQGLVNVLDHTPIEFHSLVHAIAAAVTEVGVQGLQELLSGRLGKLPDDAPGPYGLNPCVLNAIPTHAGAPQFCAPLALAVASGTQAPGGWAMVLRLLRAHLVTCGVGPNGLTDRTAILVTDTFVRRAWYESSRDVLEHMQHAGLTFVGMHWNGRRWVFFKP